MKHTIANHIVSRETFGAVEELVHQFKDELLAYTDKLLWWNSRINLVSRHVSRETILEHICHALILTQFKAFKEAGIIVDAGTGGGLPGIPLAITTPEKEFILNDIVSKKVMAVKQMARDLKLQNVRTAAHSVDKLKINHPFLLVSKHAFKVHDLYKMTDHLTWQQIIFYKGIPFEKELAPINDPVDISAYLLSQHGVSDFYNQKAIICLSRRPA